MTDGRHSRARVADVNAEPEGFLSRWSRLKRESAPTVDESTSAAPAVAPPTVSADSTQSAATGTNVAVPAATEASVAKPAAGAPDAAAEELPPIESLDGLNSDYVPFFRQPVAESLRRAALKKLFSDPHFNVMDGLDTYIDDYTTFEPIPEPLRQQLMSAAGFLNRAMPEAEARQQPSPESAESAESAEPATAPVAPGMAADSTEPAGQPAGGPPPEAPTVVAVAPGQDGALPSATTEDEPAA